MGRVGRGSPLVITLPRPLALVAQSEARAENGVLITGEVVRVDGARALLYFVHSLLYFGESSLRNEPHSFHPSPPTIWG